MGAKIILNKDIKKGNDLHEMTVRLSDLGEMQRQTSYRVVYDSSSFIQWDGQGITVSTEWLRYYNND